MIDWTKCDFNNLPKDGKHYLVRIPCGFEIAFISHWGYWSTGNSDVMGVTHYAELTKPLED